VNLNNILMGTDNAPRLVEYYTKLLGAPLMSEGGYTSWAIGKGGLTVGQHSEVHGKNDQPGRLIWNIESDDVPGDFARMRDAGAMVIREPYTMEGMEGMDGTWIATLTDPDGNYFQLITPFDPSTMGGDQG
jgi:predicted enzyme related to lactoylglutathione lyase